MNGASNKPPVYLGRDDVYKYLHSQWNSLIYAIENALSLYSLGEVIQPVRTVVPVERHSGMLLTMPGYSSKDDALAAKLVTIYPQNKVIGLPTIQAIVLLYVASTGELQAIFDGQIITNMRTAAASAVATKYLASANPHVLAILGAGEQARSHYQALTHMYNTIQKVCVWNIHKETAEKFVKEINKDGLIAECCETVEKAVKEADIIVTVTMSQKPVLEKRWVKPGAHINAVGAPAPTWQEISEELMLSSTVYVDSREAAMEESGDIIKSGAEIYAEIGEIIAGKKQVFQEKTTIFKSLGMAVEDIVTAKLVFDLYKREDRK